MQINNSDSPTRTALLPRLIIATSTIALLGCATDLPAQNQLIGRAVLPAATFSEGPTSGRQLGSTPVNGQAVPFVNKQPVQGFSATLDNGDGTFLSMSDNGFGSIENSADYHLRVYRIRPAFETAKGGSGTIAVEGFFELSDPDKHIAWTITQQFTDKRILTGADFDIESMQRAPDGTLWFGDEFGPFLLHTDSTGKLLEAPIALPDFDTPGKDIRAPQNPLNEETSALRIMNAVRHHARIHGNDKAPVFSPWFVMIDDGNAATGIDNRMAPPAGSGLTPASSDIFNVGLMQRAGYPVVTWTVNDKPSMTALMKLKVNGIISDRSDLLLEAVKEFDANNDGTPGDFLTSDGLIDINKFDAQGHRGSRNLRPENTIPAMEVALDNLMTTLELDLGMTKDLVPVLSHDAYIESQKARRRDGAPYGDSDEVLIKNLTLAEIQSTFIADKLFRGPSQQNNPALSPVSVQFFGGDVTQIYIHPTLQQVFDFVKAYAAYYKTGAGAGHPEASKRAKNADQVRFNIETKMNPRTDRDLKNNVFFDRTVPVEAFTKSVADVIVANNQTERGDVQSFDFRSLLLVQEKYPQIRTVYLFGDFPKFADPTIPGSDDGTNLQDQNGANTPWLAGMYWPYRTTRLTAPFRAQGSGGFEGMALSKDGETLLPLLEKPLIGGTPNTLLIHEFDLASKEYTGVRYQYPLAPRGVAIGDFIMFDKNSGLVIERDNTQGDINGFKAIYEITLKGDNQPVEKRLAVDLNNISDPNMISAPAEPGDVGLGNPFSFPFVTIEDVIFFNSRTIGVLNDNNYPFSIGRHAGSARPDDNEFILIHLDTPLTSNGKAVGKHK